MFIELIDLLRCTRPHEDSWLVAMFHEMRERDVVEGLLSCPVCEARYPIMGGVAWFDLEPGTAARMDVGADADGMRAAAYLNLVEPGVVLLEGEWGGASEAVAALDCTVITLNSAAGAGGAKVSRIRANGTVPLARECLDGIASASASAALLEGGARALKVGARMIAPVGAQLPVGMAELARDEKWWVAAREGMRGSAPVQIARTRR
jgi:uncharacterized protein YbaR (Trm112 family)